MTRYGDKNLQNFAGLEGMKKFSPNNRKSGIFSIRFQLYLFVFISLLLLGSQFNIFLDDVTYLSVVLINPEIFIRKLSLRISIHRGLVAMFLKLSPEERLLANDNAARTILEVRYAYRQEKKRPREMLTAYLKGNLFRDHFFLVGERPCWLKEKRSDGWRGRFERL